MVWSTESVQMHQKGCQMEMGILELRRDLMRMERKLEWQKLKKHLLKSCRKGKETAVVGLLLLLVQQFVLWAVQKQANEKSDGPFWQRLLA
jgi:hypothetical protein